MPARRKAPAGCYWRNGTLWAQANIKGVRYQCAPRQFGRKSAPKYKAGCIRRDEACVKSTGLPDQTATAKPPLAGVL